MLWYDFETCQLTNFKITGKTEKTLLIRFLIYSTAFF